MLTQVLVDGLRKLVNGRRDFQTAEKDALLSLQTDVFRPLDKTSEISLVGKSLSNSVFPGTRSKKGVFSWNLFDRGGSCSGGSLLLSSFGLLAHSLTFIRHTEVFF